MNYRCLEIPEPTDADWSAQPNYLCYPFKTPLLLSWSTAGPRPGMKCTQLYDPQLGGGWANDYLCYDNGTVGVLGELPRNSAGLCLDMDGAGNALTAPCSRNRWRMQTLAAGGQTALILEPTDVGDSSPRCLGVAGAGAAAGNRVVLENCNRKASQTWELNADLTLRNHADNTLCMVTAGTGAVVLGACDGSVATQWTLQRNAVTPF